ncbi:hypothetical protein F3Y22_tig00110105pilonHSYRG00033 [Hibiscus syriacus]|uniref:NB-ARC domain-containing protein n=1 Tax=Hibiscus syriacus TaxID=106335 RepID=A0A6A3BIP9_HIBSY|nr:hypothetical protein F3Y22_tig00110105pilonHSYRG00033 [Hibiscus syriacus]
MGRVALEAGVGELRHRGEFDKDNETKQLVDIIDKGRKRISKCCKINWWNLIRNGVAIRRLSLREGSSNGNEMCSQVADVGAFKVPKPQGQVVRFDEHWKELKTQLFKEGVSVIVVYAPGGSGKSTLVKQLCQDEEKHSKTPKVEVILQKLHVKNHSGVSEFQSEEDCLNQQEQKFKARGNQSHITDP